MIERVKIADAGRLGARVEVAERILVGEAHVLLLQRQPHLLAERATDPVGCESHGAGEAEAGLDRDDEQIDEIRQLVLDPIASEPDLPLDVARVGTATR